VNADRSPTEVLEDLLDEQLLAVLGSQYQGAPYTSLVAFAATDAGRRLIFATARSTRKYRNLSADPRASMLIDNRDNAPADFADAAAVTAVGRCVEPEGDARHELAELFLRRHPQLSDFVHSPSCALMVLEVEVFMLVRRFQQVVELRPAP
jgi:putative heme iron utilization protein